MANDCGFIQSTTHFPPRARRTLFDALLPEAVTNEFGDKEDAIAYVLRHTQLLPRHLLIFFNEMAKRSLEKTGGLRLIDPSSIVDGVRNKEEDVVGEILAPYSFLYEDIGNKLKTDLAALPPLFSYGELDKVISRLRRRLEFEDHFPVWELLFQIGVIGKVKKEAPKVTHYGVSYVLAEFHYNHTGGVAFPMNELYCLHPLFSRYVSAISNRGGDKSVIYPRDVPTEID
jgi:hypothetical protein